MMANGAWRSGGRLASRPSFLVIVAMALISGCTGGGGDNKPTAKVTGKVTYDGKPVPGGLIMFSPIRDAKTPMSGKAGQAVIKSDGTYSVTTYAEGDGAVIGKHAVSFSPPATAQPPAAPDGAHVASAAPESPYAGLAPKQAEVSVVKGDNKIDIELVKQAAPAAAPGGAAPSGAHGN